MSGPIISLVVARARNGVIGQAGAIPWRLPADLAQFKAITMGKPVLMGRKTWDSLPRRPLPGRPNLVLSRDPGFRAAGGWTFSSVPAALAAAGAMQAGEVCVIGGAALYAETLPLAQRIYLTEVDAAPAGDTLFPPLDEAAFHERSRTLHPADAENRHAFAIRILERR